MFEHHFKHTNKKNVKEKNGLLREYFRVMKEYLAGLETFMHQADSTPLAQESDKMFCPCRKCNNSKLANRENVWKHLINRGFTPNYYIWFQHGEGYNYD